MLLITAKQIMLLTNRQRRKILTENNLSLSYNDIELHKRVVKIILGVDLDDNSEWNNHFQHVCKYCRLPCDCFLR